jgi:hypothetical protein
MNSTTVQTSQPYSVQSLDHFALATFVLAVVSLIFRFWARILATGLRIGYGRTLLSAWTYMLIMNRLDDWFAFGSLVSFHITVRK